jgi:hypothetical protein
MGVASLPCFPLPFCCPPQADFEEERGRRVKEVAYDLNRRLRQELAAPVIIHFVVTQV